MDTQHYLIAMTREPDGTMTTQDWTLTADEMAAAVAPLGPPDTSTYLPGETAARLSRTVSGASIVVQHDRDTL